MSYATGCRSTFTPMQTAILRGSVTSYIPGFFPRVENDFDVFEPDNYPETATSLPFGDVQCHTFHWSPLSPNEFSACDADWYRVDVPAFGALAIKTFAVLGQPEPDTYLELFDTSMTLLAANDSLLGSDFAWIPATNLDAGSYFIRASHRSMSGTAESRGHYHIQANLTAPVAVEATDFPQPVVSVAYDPATQVLTIDFKRSKTSTYTLTLHDLQGRIQATHRLHAHTGAHHQLPLVLPAGVYIARLASPTTSLQKKFLIF